MPFLSSPCGAPPSQSNAGGTFWYNITYDYQCNAGFQMIGQPAQITCDVTRKQWSSPGFSCVPIDTRHRVDNYINVPGVPIWLVGLVCGLVGIIALSCLVFTIAYLCGLCSSSRTVHPAGWRRSRRSRPESDTSSDEERDVRGTYVIPSQSSQQVKHQTVRHVYVPGLVTTKQNNEKTWMPHKHPIRDINTITH